MAHSNKETLSVIWCDNGNTDGKFTEGLVYSIITGEVPFHNAIRVQGNQIARQRQAAFDMWNKVGTDWALWVDSDIVLTKEVVKILWDTADKVSRPVVSGVYFISKQMENSLMQPMPAIFDEGETEYEIKYKHPLPRSQVLKVDSAGLGLVLIHKSVIKALHNKHGETDFLFAENNATGEQFIGEDISFFRKIKAAGVPVYANTSALVKHMKRFAFDDNYYNLYWAAIEGAERAKQNADTTSE
jgi:hypothetical protein